MNRRIRPTGWRAGAACSLAEVPVGLWPSHVAKFYPVVEPELITAKHPIPADIAWRAALATCGACPVARDCLVEAVVNGHGKSEKLGIRAGLSSDKRRPLRRAYVLHGWRALAALVEEHVSRLEAGLVSVPVDELEPDTPGDRNTSGVTHGKRSTANRGCPCDACRLRVSFYSRERRRNTTRQRRKQTA